MPRLYVASAPDWDAPDPWAAMRPLGTVEAAERPAALKIARALWGGLPGAGDAGAPGRWLRVTRASACRPGALLAALAADGASAGAGRPGGP